MALELSSGGQSVSPASSGRASPVSRKWRNQLGGDEPPNKDKAFRRYASGVDRSLSLFDTALQEWADYISFLGRLLKSLQAHPTNIAAVPSKAIVAKRLAQCLNPSLPSGVHQKALEVYGYVFSMIGKDELSKDLPLYLPGLSTTLSFASLSVRGPFLELLEKHLLGVDGRSLRPALKAIILALLPGLEEENSDEFERTLKLLDGFKHAVRPSGTEDLGENHSSGDEYFWQCFFLAAITSNGRRLGALAYLNRNLPKLGHSPSEQGNLSSNGSNKNDNTTNQSQLAEIVTSPEPGLLLRCFAAGLGDEQILIQRGFLDLLVTHLPLHSNVLQQRVKPEDLELLVTAAAGVVTRRDMSLNRRLWTWLLGPEPTGHDNENGPESPTSVSGDPLGSHASSRTQYFESYGLNPLTQALLKLIRREAINPIEKARPFRICLSLMDRWEIGGLVVPYIFLPVVSSVRGYKSKASNKTDFAEVLRSASVFFDGVESGLIWGEIVGLIAQALAPGKLSTEEQIDKLSLVTFIINHFNVREEEMLLIHAPLATLTIVSMLEDAKERVQERAEKAIVTNEVERTSLSGAASTGQSVAKNDEDETKALSNTQIIRSLETFYVQEQGNLDASPPPFSIRDVSELLIRQGGSIARESLSSSVSSTDAGVKTRLLVVLLSKVPRTTLTLENHDIEASICNLMIEHDLNGTYASRDADPGRSFSILWTHSLQDNAGHLDRRSSNNETKNTPRLSGTGNYEVMLAKPLFLLLDALLDERTQLFMNWELQLEHVLIQRLSHSLTGTDPFIQVLLLDVVYAALKIRPVVNLPPPSPTLKKRSTTMTSNMTQHDNISVASLSIEQSEHTGPFLPPPPPSLVKCLQAGFGAASSRSVLDSWCAGSIKKVDHDIFIKRYGLVTFLVEYARSLEDDAMDEIWVDCITFLRDLLANPFPHRQTLPSLLEFAAILGVKVDNTNFGEQRRMRRELGDLFLRLLTAMFTTRPMGFSESVEKLTETDQRPSSSRPPARSDDIVGILASIAPDLPKILVENDRILSAANTISSSVIGPTFKSRSFPDNVSNSTLELLYQLSRLPNTQKSWRKDLGDAFNDSRFFANNVSLIESDWLPLLRQWTLSDKERMPELLSRLVAPSTAGIVFGVGATSARFEADRKSQLNLRRMATLVLATMDDNFVTDLPVMQEKIVELLAATPTSSPSSTTRADIYLLLRALVLKTSAIHLATLWPIINAELHVAISSVVAT
ncbi:hypothetical protein DID88_007676 [Monilinia fructigena]|uniref:Uncharacterized protein n=1 Tax=Monilinia fructigena TaxID=38457 RepID=A0A395J448_9HELO|nr:hypothetical protein DID88_007676 [Monilinia fructigena]